MVHHRYKGDSVIMNIQHVDFFAKNASEQFTQSLKETGFAILETHPLDNQLIQDLYQEWRDFLTSDAAKQYFFSKENQDGYFPKEISEIAKGQTVKDLKHYYHLYFPWGRYPQEVSEKAQIYFEQTFELGKTLMGWIEAHMNSAVKEKLSQDFSNMLSFDRTLLRIMQYPALTKHREKGAIRAAAHEDINIITVLPVANESGLQVFSKVDGLWHDVDCHAGAVVINIGDMLQEMTNKEYISTSHRVLNPIGEAAKRDRMSMPTFLHAKADVFLSDQYPTADAYLQERLRELGVK